MSALERPAFAIREWREDDLAALHVINEANDPAVASVPAEELLRLARSSYATLVAELDGAPIGFLLCLDEGADYQSLNFRWLKQRYARFAYVDRIAVDKSARGFGVGAELYAALEWRIAGGRPVLTCEVNERPPNPGSLRFHTRLGFEQIGRAEFAGGTKAVVYMAKSLSLA